MVWYGMVNVDLYSAIITKVSNALNTLVSGEKPKDKSTHSLSHSQTDRQTDRQTHHNTLLPYTGAE